MGERTWYTHCEQSPCLGLLPILTEAETTAGFRQRFSLVQLSQPRSVRDFCYSNSAGLCAIPTTDLSKLWTGPLERLWQTNAMPIIIQQFSPRISARSDVSNSFSHGRHMPHTRKDGGKAEGWHQKASVKGTRPRAIRRLDHFP